MVKDIKKIFEQPTFASKGGLKEFNDEQRAKGWESIGKEAPESTQFNVLQNDVERGVKYLYGQIREAIRSTSPNYVPDEMKATDLREAIEGITKAQTAQAIQQAKNDAAAANKNAESRLAKAANLSDIADKRQARENLGLGKLALANDYPEASLSQKGIVQLSSATDSDSETLAATAKAVKAAMDLAASSAVKSVNGKKGEVRLTPDDIGALAQTGGTVSGAVIVEGNQLVLKGDDRKHLGFHNQDGSVRMWLYKDKGGDGVHLNNGEDGGGDWLFHKNGNFHAPASIFAGGNVTVSWGGRTATFHENGDVTGPIWGGALSAWLNNQLNSRTRTQVSGGRGGWWYKDELSGFVFQGGVVSRSGSNTRVTFPVGYQRECFGVQMTLSAWRQSSGSNIFATGIENSGFTAVMCEQEVEANWWAVGV